MKSILYKSLFFAILTAGFVSSCANDDNYSDPTGECTQPDLTVTKTVQQIIATATGAPKLYEQDDIIEGYVTSSDEQGTFFKSVSLQTLPTDGSAPIGFSVALNVNSTFIDGFTPGTKVYIKLKGLYYANVYNSLVIGAFYQPTPSDTPAVGRISENLYKNYIFPSCTKVDESKLVRTVTLAQAYTNANLNTLIEIDNVRFADGSIGRTYFDVDSGGGATNHFITSTTGGASNIIRFSSFAPFSGNKVKSGSGKIRGVMTKYNSDFQFIVRYEGDIQLGGTREFTYPSTFTENFESYALNESNFRNYFNNPILGTKVWAIKSAASKYLEMTSFGGTAENNRTLFFMPVNMTDANSMTFKYKVNFAVAGHTPLKVYYTTNYTPGQNINTATLVDITSSFTVGTSTNFVSAGTYNIPTGVTGNGFFVFEYTGSGLSNPRLTTNFGIDDVTVN
ncbi:DUF5689 domain-containing protein [uncultured Flavobacterium sp.]|uniref:DUF5689 domain-containing protein n=1 Tax=uncultured Flavobacterium sp. TaxID=165435 RepID=UPI0025EE192E|nr:DUF5689 domain-containing protein [uncultured Flavobacterium sp.]